MKMLVCDALDERDFLRKKIIANIKKAKFAMGVKKGQSEIDGKSIETFEEKARSDMQSILDCIKRYNEIDSAITLSNAATELKTRAGTTLTVAKAIQLKKLMAEKSHNDFTAFLLEKMRDELQSACCDVASMNSKANTELEKYKSNLTNGDVKNLSDEQVIICQKMVEDSYGKLVDPLNLEKKIDELAEKHSSLIRDLKSAISKSNATTFIELKD